MWRSLCRIERGGRPVRRRDIHRYVKVGSLHAADFSIREALQSPIKFSRSVRRGEAADVGANRLCSNP